MLVHSAGKTKEIEAEIPLGLGRVQLVRESWNEPIDVFGSAREHHLELTLLRQPLNARACFPDHWGPHRFEPFGPMFLLPAAHRVHAKSDCRQQNSIVCSFTPESVAAWFDCDLQWTHRRLQSSLNIVSPTIRNLMQRIGAEIRSPGFACETLIELMAAQLFIEVSRLLAGIDDLEPAGGLPSWRLRRIEDRLSSDGPPPSLSELARLCNLSVRHLTRGFRISRGRSIGSFLAENCVENAKRLLASGAQIKEVAYSLGFSAPSNFAAAFRRATGESPRQYRQRVAPMRLSLPAKPH